MSQSHAHIKVNKQPDLIPFTSKKQHGADVNIPQRIRQEHGDRILENFQEVWDRIEANQLERSAVALPTKKGAYIEFRSQAGYELITKSLDSVQQGIRLLNVRQVGDQYNRETIATVFVPSGKQNVFLKK